MYVISISDTNKPAHASSYQCVLNDIMNSPYKLKSYKKCMKDDDDDSSGMFILYYLQKRSQPNNVFRCGGNVFFVQELRNTATLDGIRPQ